jgi:drug/metabolite transporter (DMT)-like permease
MRRAEWARLVAAFAAVYVIWGSTYLAIGVTVESVPPVFMVALRGVLAGGALYAFGRLRGEAPITMGEIRAAVPSAALLFGGGYVLVGWSAQYLPTGITALLNATIPAFVVLIEWGTGRRARPGLWVTGGLISGLLGVGFLVWSRTGSEQGAGMIPVIALLAASFFWALGSVRAGGAKNREETKGGRGEERRPSRQAAVQLLTSALLLFPVSVLLGEWEVVWRGGVGVRSLIGLAYLVVFGSLIGYSSYVWLLHHVPAGKAASHAYVNPLIAVLLGGWLGREALDAGTLLSLGLIVFSVAAIIRGETPPAGRRPVRRSMSGSLRGWRALLSAAVPTPRTPRH